MEKFESQILDISKLELLAIKFCKNLKIGDIVFLKGELGVGKTTFSRLIINNLFKLNNKNKPNKISSPTYPILLTYNLNKYEVYHYDLYRIKTIGELEELDFYENIQNSITLIEWPELLINIPFQKSYYLINLNMYSEKKRSIKIDFIKKNL